jgi:salicylate hydroxylase
VRKALTNLGRSIRWPMYDREPAANWIDGRMVLIGDAAHPMLQYLAQGACQALEDAAALQDLSKGTVFTKRGIDAGAWDEVMKSFNDVRAPRTARVQRTARVWGESWHVDGVGRTLRNMLFQKRADGDYSYTDWLYGQDAS